MVYIFLMNKTLAVYLNHYVDSWSFRHRHKRILEDIVPGLSISVHTMEDDFLSVLPDADAVLSWDFKQEWFDTASKLKAVITPAAGRDFLPVTPPDGVQLHFGSFHGEIITETIVGMVCSHSRGILRSYQLQKTIEWPRAELGNFSQRVAGSTAVIYGFGTIGKAIGKTLKSLGTRIIGVRRTEEQPPSWFNESDKMAIPAEIPLIMPETNHLIMVLPGGIETDKVISRRELNLLPENAGIYNVGRGNSIDEDALAEVLKERVNTEAYLDVFQEEPLPMTSTLRKVPNCLVMPHASAIAPDYIDLFVYEIGQKIKTGRIL